MKRRMELLLWGYFILARSHCRKNLQGGVFTELGVAMQKSIRFEVFISYYICQQNRIGIQISESEELCKELPQTRSMEFYLHIHFIYVNINIL